MRITSTTAHVVKAAALALCISTAAIGNENIEATSVSDHVIFNTDQIVNGATILIRDGYSNSVSATISSNALESDTAYSIWWAIFNEPGFCAEPFACTVSDLEVFGGDAQIKASVFWAGGFVSDQSGTANTALRLGLGTTSRERFAQTKDYGLQNLWGAEIHLVMRTHGPTGIAGSVAEQIGTANMACPPDGCQNVFASVHLAGQSEVPAGNCDYSNAGVNDGWGWDPVAQQSCQPLN